MEASPLSPAGSGNHSLPVHMCHRMVNVLGPVLTFFVNVSLREDLSVIYLLFNNFDGISDLFCVSALGICCFALQ